MRKLIEINVAKEALHCWPDAFLEVEYLKNKHRHVFHIRMRKLVTHSDRETEFIHWKHEVEAHLQTLPFDLEHTSCETIAEDLLKQFGCTYVRVMEDGESGAIVEQHVETTKTNYF